MQLALSRSREFNADMGAVEITGDPIGLANALEKIELMAGGQVRKVIGKEQLKQPAFLRTHPATKDRIRELNEVAIENEQKRNAIAAAAFPKQAGQEEIHYIGDRQQPDRAKYYVMTGIFR